MQANTGTLLMHSNEDPKLPKESQIFRHFKQKKFTTPQFMNYGLEVEE